jgi:methylphosphotriester-DNA--protein-cysteine methyltransferase
MATERTGVERSGRRNIAGGVKPAYHFAEIGGAVREGAAARCDASARAARRSAKKPFSIALGLVGQHAADDFGVVIQFLVREQVEHRAADAGLGSVAAYTTRARRACIIAPEHMAQGSSVTYSSQPGRR